MDISFDVQFHLSNGLNFPRYMYNERNQKKLVFLAKVTQERKDISIEHDLYLFCLTIKGINLYERFVNEIT